MRISEIAKRAIDLANELDSKVPAQGAGPLGTDAVLLLKQWPADEYVLEEYLLSLSEADIYWLTTIMYIGRDDLKATDLSGSHEEVRWTFATPQLAAAQMAGKGRFADYLRDGLAAIVNAGIDLDAEVEKLQMESRPALAST